MVEENDMFGRTNRADGPLDIAILAIGVLIVEPSRLVSCKNNPTSHLSCPPFDMFGRAKIPNTTVPKLPASLEQTFRMAVVLRPELGAATSFVNLL